MVPTGTLSPVPGQNCNSDRAQTWSVPDVRSDCSWRLALLLREIHCLNDPGVGCWATNQYLAQKIKCRPATVKDLVAILKAHGLVEAVIQHGRDRFIRPLVSLTELFPLWRALADACRKTKRLAAGVRRAASDALQRLSRRPVRPPVARNSAPSPQATPRLTPYSKDGVDGVTEKQQTPPQAKPNQAPTEAPAPPVVVPSPTASSADPQLVAAIEALGVPQTTAKRLITGKSGALVRQALRAVEQLHQAGKAHNVGGLLTVAIREGWKPSAPPSEHASDRAERLVRYVQAPKGFQLRPAPSTNPAPVPHSDDLDLCRARIQRYKSRP